MNKFCEYLFVDVLLSLIRHYSFLILNHQKSRFYEDGQEYKANSDYDLFQLIDHDFSSLFKTCSKHNSKIFEC